ncbi:MAG: prepilin-type N-terminal cleavage/methylation domain-containing protein [Candidatus Saccharibacteria bacterium]
MKKSLNKQAGFTLLELIIVIVAIAILVFVAISIIQMS